MEGRIDWDRVADSGRCDGCGRRKARAAGGRLRFRDQAEHFALAGGSRLRGDCSSGADFRGRCAGVETGWRVLVEWAGRSGADSLRRFQYSEAFGTRADFWDLPGASVVRAGIGREDVQVEVRASRRESPGAEFADAKSGNYFAEPWILRGSGIAAFERSGNYACEFE